jgi:hypothetical protein
MFAGSTCRKKDYGYAAYPRKTGGREILGRENII